MVSEVIRSTLSKITDFWAKKPCREASGSFETSVNPLPTTRRESSAASDRQNIFGFLFMIVRTYVVFVLTVSVSAGGCGTG